MSLEEELHEEMLSMYQRAGEEANYWGTRYLQAVRRKGGLRTAQDMLKPRATGQHAGLDKLLEAKRPDLTLEFLILEEKYQTLFTKDELKEANRRLGEFKRKVREKPIDRLFPDELELGIKYPEGARKQVRVNKYERSDRARNACLKHHGTDCSVCRVSFGARYGTIGEGFIHVHHLRQVSELPAGYRVDPIKDLAPVCPNCHAMLHRESPPLSVKELRDLINAENI